MSSPKNSRRRVQAYPAIGNVEQLRDFLARAAWHFSHVDEIELFVPLAPGLEVPTELSIPDGFAPQVQVALSAYLPRVRFQLDQSDDKARRLLDRADIVLKLVEGDSGVDEALKASKKQTFRVDPVKVRQEGSFFIQCAFDLYAGKAKAIEDSRRKFDRLLARIGRRSKAWVMATGPSVENFSDHDFSDAAVIVCNSVVLNDELMEHCSPDVLVFADPIFHFGVSEYAGRFREVVEQRLSSSNLTVVVPLKYYPLLVSRLPRHADRIIGVPFEKIAAHNFDLRSNFQVKTTANILTLLLLPLATTLAPVVNLIGCDGRPLEQDDYFWSHGKSVQINDKMDNIRRVHPGFFAIDYNEYYFEHCHTLANLLKQGEDAGWRFVHHGPSHIPALRDRPSTSLALPLSSARDAAARLRKSGATACLVLEPDGLGTSGHYVHWHRNLIAELGKLFERVDLLCNLKQDPALYPCPARPAFSSFSWSVSRSDFAYRRDFTEHATFKRFVDELVQGIRAHYQPLPRTLSLYVYYGSVQILKAVQLARQALAKDGLDLKAFVCLFHESVILKAEQLEPRFPPNSFEILMEGAAQIDNYRIASVTERLAELILSRYGVTTEVFPNPVPGVSDADVLTMLQDGLVRRRTRSDDDRVTVLLPSNPREEKGAQIIRDLVVHLATHGVPNGHLYRVRGRPPEGYSGVAGIEFLGDEVSDADYRSNLSSADVAIIPYPEPAFRYRTSGILADALLAGVPLVVLADTWLADVVQSTGAGLAINYRSPLSLVSAVKVLANNRELMDRRIAMGARAYVEANSWRATAAVAMR